MEVFKSLGINVGGDQSLIKQPEQKTDLEKGEIETHVVRKGFGGNARDALESQLSKGFSLSMKKESLHAEPEGERVENPSLKNTHGEEFHSDNNKQVEKLQSTAEVIEQDRDGEDKDPKRKPKKRSEYDYASPGRGEGNARLVVSMKSEQSDGALFLKAMADKACGTIKKDLATSMRNAFGGGSAQAAPPKAPPPPPPPPPAASSGGGQTMNARMGNPFGKAGHPIPPIKPSMAAKKQPKDAEQKKEERQQKMGKSHDHESLIIMAPDPFNERTIANVHENSPGVAERRRTGARLDFSNILERSSMREEIDLKKKKAQKGALVDWAKEEEKEEEHKKSELDEIFDLIKGDKIEGGLADNKKPSEFPKKQMDMGKKVEREHTKDPKIAQEIASDHLAEDKKYYGKLKQMEAKKSFGFIKSAGQGGIVFDFGPLTGNPVADRATALLNEFADPIQTNNANYQRESYNEAIVEYTKKGEAGFGGTKTMFGNIEKGWADQLNKPMDQQVKEAFDAGQLNDTGFQANSKFAGTQANVGGTMVKAMSETDAAVLEMFKAEQEQLSQRDGGGFVADASTGGKIKITAGE